MRVFFAGIIQGSKKGQTVHSQDYRNELKRLITNSHRNIEIFDPVDGHQESINYDDARAREVFFGHLKIIDSCDMLIAFLPEASMGTAIEMREAFEKKIPIITISPMTSNWVIRLLSFKNFETVKDFERFVSKNDIGKLVAEFHRGIVEEKV
jgi:nucleoside 2-deoxyribosyltransferase